MHNKSTHKIEGFGVLIIKRKQKKEEAPGFHTCAASPHLGLLKSSREKVCSLIYPTLAFFFSLSFFLGFARHANEASPGARVAFTEYYEVPSDSLIPT